MCGIAGYYAFGNSLPAKGDIEELFINTQVRGNDASGYAYTEDNSLRVQKLNAPAAQLVRTKAWRNLVMPRYMILHCRAATKGDPKDSKNNHPLFSKSGTAIVHNGILQNDDEVFNRYRFERDGQVDSELLLRLLDLRVSWASRIKKLGKEVVGSYTIAAIHTGENTLTLLRHDNPLAIAYDKARDILYFASTRSLLTRSLTVNYRGLSFLRESMRIADIPDNTAWLISKDGIDSKLRFETRQYDYWYSNDDYEEGAGIYECQHCYSVFNSEYLADFGGKCPYCRHTVHYNFERY